MDRPRRIFIETNARIRTRWSQVTDFSGLRAALFDVDPLVDDMLSEGTVEAGGTLWLRCDKSKVRSFDSPLETAPDLRWVIMRTDGRVVFRSRVVRDVLLPAAPATGLLACDLTFVESSLDRAACFRATSPRLPCPQPRSDDLQR